MNFTPLMAHRYLQKQINELCFMVKQEKDLNEKFRDASDLQSFKFFTQNNLLDLESSMKEFKDNLESIKNTVEDQGN